MNFFNISDLNKKQLMFLVNEKNLNNLISGKNIGLIFEKYSTRTRLSFGVGISQLQGNAIDIKFEELNISREESFEDTFKAMNLYLDGLVYRTNNHRKLIKAKDFFKKPIINALSDISHPCQIISDLFTLNQRFKSLNLNILWMGDMNNVCFSLVEAANLIEDLKLYICCPKKISKNKKWNLTSNIFITDKINEINLPEINCVMTDVFISMNDQNNVDKIRSLNNYQVNQTLMSNTHKNSVFMHCLPAKVGYEVSEEVFHSKKSIVWTQAYNRLVCQKKLLQLIYK